MSEAPENTTRRRAPYIVWSPEGETPPKVSHPTHGPALFAANRMAKFHPGQTFYVMQRASQAIVVPAPDEQPAAEIREEEVPY